MGHFRQIVVSAERYLRVTTTQKSGPPLTRIFSETDQAYWELHGTQGFYLPLREVLFRLAQQCIRKRWEAREAIVPFAPLLRLEAWPYVSGDPTRSVAMGPGEPLLGFPTQRIRIGAVPLWTWEVEWTSQVKLPERSCAFLYLSLGAPHEVARELASRIEGLPVRITMKRVDGKRRAQYILTAVPAQTGAEEVADIVPPELLQATAKQEAQMRARGVLLRIIDGEKPPEGVTLLGACVRFARTLSRKTVQSAVKRFEAMRDPEARRFLMIEAARAAPDRAVSRLRYLVRAGPLEVARDAAWALSEVLSPQEAAQAVGVVLRRARRGEAPVPEQEKLKLKHRIYLWGTDLLRTLTGRDWGFWPGVNEEQTVGKWLEYLSEQSRSPHSAAADSYSR